MDLDPPSTLHSERLAFARRHLRGRSRREHFSAPIRLSFVAHDGVYTVAGAVWQVTSRPPSLDFLSVHLFKALTRLRIPLIPSAAELWSLRVHQSSRRPKSQQHQEPEQSHDESPVVADSRPSGEGQTCRGVESSAVKPFSRCAVSLVVIGPVVTGTPVLTQQPGTRFEVASVKPSDPNAVGPLGKPPALPGTRTVGGRYIASNHTLRDLIKFAYDFYFDFRIDGGPEWQASRRFDVQAAAEAPTADRLAMRPMVRALLADRFKLKVHMETREVPIFALVVARDDRRLGPSIRPSALDCSDPARPKPAEVAAALERAGRGAAGVACAIWPVPSRGTVSYAERANGAAMENLADMLTAQTGRMVYDRTGLVGFYDWEMTYDRRATLSPAQPGASTDSPGLTTALQEQLGLKLESTRGPVEVLVIDSAALPEPD